MTPPIVIELLATLAIVCGLAPTPEAWEPDQADVALISRTIWGEARGCEPEEQEAVAWCILNRVDDERFPGTVEGVVTQPWQFQGYSAGNPADNFAGMAEDVLRRWHEGERGIDPSLVFFEGDGKHNYFRSEW